MSNTNTKNDQDNQSSTLSASRCYAVGDIVTVAKDQDCWACGTSHPKRGDKVTVKAVGKESVQFIDIHGRTSTIWKKDLEFADEQSGSRGGTPAKDARVLR